MGGLAFGQQEQQQKQQQQQEQEQERLQGAPGRVCGPGGCGESAGVGAGWELQLGLATEAGVAKARGARP